MTDSFHIKVVTPSGAALEKEASSLTIFSKQGEITLLPGHCLLLSALEAGRMTVFSKEGDKQVFAVAGGYLEAGPDHANVICDRCVSAEELDSVSLQKRLSELEEQLQKVSEESPESHILIDELKWTKACLAISA